MASDCADDFATQRYATPESHPANPVGESSLGKGFCDLAQPAPILDITPEVEKGHILVHFHLAVPQL